MDMRIHVDDADLPSPVAHLPVTAEDDADAGGIHELKMGKIEDEQTDAPVGDQLVQIPPDALCAVMIQLTGQPHDQRIDCSIIKPPVIMIHRRCDSRTGRGIPAMEIGFLWRMMGNV